MIVKEKAYAKINLILNVLNKREDGFHNVDFLMHSLELHDDVIVEISDKDEISVDDNPKLSSKYNLAFKAMVLMRKKYKLDHKYKIRIIKRIPVAAGMAGGSSDAAATLRAINKLENLNLEIKELESIAQELGSDVPFCLYSTLARATNRGEKIELINKEIEKFYVVAVNPGVKLSTPKVFKNHIISDVHQDVPSLIEDLSYENLTEKLFNNLEITAEKICKPIEVLKNELTKYTDKKILLSGSGPTVFIIFNDKEEAEYVYNKIKGNYENSYITKLR